jgi:hypothetical protein
MGKKLTLKKNEILVLRDVKPDMNSRNGFIWPKSGRVTAPDWQDTDRCGKGLHGLPWGCGGDYRIGGDNALWLVVRVNTSRGQYQHGTGEMNDKCKFETGAVVFCGSRESAIALIAKYAPGESPINWRAQITENYSSTQTAGIGSTQKAGDGSTQKADYSSTQKAGESSTQTAGHSSTQTAGIGSTQTAGYSSTQTAGHSSTQTAGDSSTQTAGESSTQTAGGGSTQTAEIGSTQTAGYSSTQKAGDSSTQTAEIGSTQTAGHSSTQTAGYSSTQTAGENSTQTQYWWDKEGCYRAACRLVGMDEAGKTYRCEEGNWVLVDETQKV